VAARKKPAAGKICVARNLANDEYFAERNATRLVRVSIAV
jgi:hypothetical protein